MIRTTLLLLSLLLVGSAAASANITFVPATHGEAGNTTMVNGDPWQPLTTDQGTNNDGLWAARGGFGNGGTIYQNLGVSHSEDNAHPLLTTVSGLPHDTYDVFVFAWSDPNAWRMRASLAEEVGSLYLFGMDPSEGVVQHGPPPSWTATSTAYSSSLGGHNPFASGSVMIAEGNRRLYQIHVGTVTGTEFSVFINDESPTTSESERTWYDGVGYALKTPFIESDRFGSVRFIDFMDLGAAGRAYDLRPVGIGDQFYLDQDSTVDSLPSGLAGNLAITTPNALPEEILLFPGSQGRGWVDTNLDPTTISYPLSFSLWTYRFNDGTARNKIWGWIHDGGANRGEFEIDGSTLKFVWWGGGPSIAVSAPPTEQWVHLGVVITPDTARLYVDGEVVGTLGDGVAPLLIQNGHDLWLGARSNPGQHEDSFSGGLKDWIVFDGDIGDAGMAQLANNTGLPSSPVIQHLPLNENVGEVVFDVSGNTLHGDLKEEVRWAHTLPVPPSHPSPEISFIVDRDVTVSIAFDADAASVPAWIANHYSDSGLTIETTGGTFNLWQRDFNARDRVNLLSFDREGATNNYWVMLSEGPDAITVGGSSLREPAEDWNLNQFNWLLTANDTAVAHPSILVGRVSDFDPANGFRVETDVRVSRLQDAGDNAFGFTLLGQYDSGVRAEWLPRGADGGSTLQLVDGASGQVLTETIWNGLVPTAINNDVGLADPANEVVFGAEVPVFSDEQPLLMEDFESGASGWTSGTYNSTPNQWEIGETTTGPQSAFKGDNVAATGLQQGYQAESDSWLRSPTLELDADSPASLVFWEYMDVDTDLFEGELMHFGAISVLDADSLGVIEEVARYSQDINQWSQREIDLSSFAGQSIVIEFRFKNDDFMQYAGEGWYLDDVQVTEGGQTIITSLPETLALDGTLNGVSTENASVVDESISHLQFTVADRAAGGNGKVTVFVAWDAGALGFEPDWLKNSFTLTDHVVTTNGADHRLWARQYNHGDEVSLGGASAAGAGPLPVGTNNYFVLFGDARDGLETIYSLSAEGSYTDGSWNIDFSLSDANGHSQTVSASSAASVNGDGIFGLFAHHPEPNLAVTHPPIWEIFDISLGVVVDLSGFEEWRALHFPGDLDNPTVSGPGASPAGDGVSNLMKYALDLLPLVPVSSEDLPRGAWDLDGNLVLEYWERTDIQDIDYIPEVSEDLIDWQSGDPFVLKFTIGSDGDIQFMEAVGNLPEEATKGFIRLNVRQKD